MTAEEVKTRVSLKDLFERDGHVLRRAGADLVCLSPFAQEKTPSCRVHEGEGYFKCFSTGVGGDCFVYYKETRKVDFKEALRALREMVGKGTATPAPVRPVARVVEVQIPPPMAGEDLARWSTGVQALLDSPEEQERIAAWRGYGVATVRWMADTGMMGLVPHYGVMREAFVVERPRVRVVDDKAEGIEGPGMIPVAYHVRLAPNTVGNLFPKASWRYQPPGCGAWPFVLGEVSTAKLVFATEGQWDALALAQVMGWVGRIPAGVAIVGMRGATSWKRFAEFFVWHGEAILFALPDRDAAGAKWFEKEGFLEVMKRRFSRIYAFRPMAVSGCKDLNDLLKAGKLNGKKLAAVFREKIVCGVRKAPGISFLAWCRGMARTREDAVGRAARYVIGEHERPVERRTRSRLEAWEQCWQRAGVDSELLASLRLAWKEWVGGRS